MTLLTLQRMQSSERMTGYPSLNADVPHELDEFHNAALVIPFALREAFLPNPSLSVDAFATLPLPIT